MIGDGDLSDDVLELEDVGAAEDGLGFGLGVGGGGFDDDDEFRKKIEELLSRIRGGVEPDVGEMTRLVKALYEAEDRSLSAFRNDNELLGQALEDLVGRIREVIDMYGGMKHFEQVAKLYDTLNSVKVTGAAKGFKDFQTPPDLLLGFLFTCIG